MAISAACDLRLPNATRKPSPNRNFFACIDVVSPAAAAVRTRLTGSIGRTPDADSGRFRHFAPNWYRRCSTTGKEVTVKNGDRGTGQPQLIEFRSTTMTSSYQRMAQDIVANALNSEINLDETERVLSAVGGGALLLTTANLRSMRGLLATVVGASLVYRGMTGHCPFYSILGMRTCSTGSNSRAWTGSSMRERTNAVVID
jgi:Protein of unknown function (DUF2892)